MENIYQANINQWKAQWHLLLISDKVDFRSKKTTETEDIRSWLKCRSTSEENLELKYTCTKNRAKMEQKLVELKGELGKSAIIVGDFNIFLSTSDRTTDRKSTRI